MNRNGVALKTKLFNLTNLFTLIAFSYFLCVLQFLPENKETTIKVYSLSVNSLFSNSYTLYLLFIYSIITRDSPFHMSFCSLPFQSASTLFTPRFAWLRALFKEVSSLYLPSVGEIVHQFLLPFIYLVFFGLV